MGGQQKYGVLPKSYINGRLQSYRYLNEKTRQEESVNVATIFAYNFGVATQREVMTVISGCIEANDVLHTPDNNPTFVFEVGDEILFTCLTTSSYHCMYGEPSVRQEG